jgi:lysyl-tRNA synthetase class 1
MFWADRIAKEIEETKGANPSRPLLVRDEKTLSGRVHVGSMRGVAIHGIVSEILTENGIDNEYKFELNDFDDFDSIPPQLPEVDFKDHLGKPLYAVPSPEPGYDSFAEYYAADFLEAHRKADFYPTYYRATELYRSGKMDPLILKALERADDVRRILKEVSGSVKDETWLPVSVICEACGKLKTTRNLEWDGKTVSYICDQSPYGAVPCGHSGRVSPLGGNAKLFWKVDWAAKWSALEVDIEGGGKDHSTKGGSRDVADHIAREIFEREPPYDIPYEFFLVGGKKMSSSKGRGSSAKDMSDLFTRAAFRLVLIGRDYNQQIDIDPEGDSVPRTYDWYDDLAEGVREGKLDDFARLFELIHAPAYRAGFLATNPWQLRFSQVAFMVQMPHLSIQQEAEAVKGSALTPEEVAALAERADYAKWWLDNYAPEDQKYRLQDGQPPESLTDAQKRAFALLAEYLSEERTGEEVHARLHEFKTEVPIAPKELFTGIYRVFLGRDSGPKAGWFLSVLPKDFRTKRLADAAVS